MSGQETKVTFTVDFEAQYGDGSKPLRPLRFVQTIGSAHDPAIEGEAGEIEILQWAGGFGFDLRHADGRQVSFDAQPLIQAALNVILLPHPAPKGD